MVLIILGMACSTQPARAEPAAVRVTTDTYEYCGILAQRLAMTPHGSEEPARSLAADGVRLCDNGHVRTGVAKLRRALRAAHAAQAAQGTGH
ncbi:MAG TPA: hypothetical protein VD970_08080 [Acetobacteraceae bacterium]|nr:hypothetical protein [Acetobacteraceae bacterium]